MIACVLFVFGALAEYAGVLCQVKIAAAKTRCYNRRRNKIASNSVEKVLMLETLLKGSNTCEKKVICTRFSNDFDSIKLNKAIVPYHTYSAFLFIDPTNRLL